MLRWRRIVATRSEIDSYQTVIDSLSTVAFGQLKTLMIGLDDPNPILYRDRLLAAYPDLVLPFTDAAGQVSAQWYLELRSEAGVKARFDPPSIPAPPQQQLEAGVRYALSPLFQPQRFIGSDALSLLAGFTQRMIANAGRETISASTAAETTRTYWQRVPRPGCCAFCGLMASRGAVYRSQDTAESHYHDFCRCVAAPRFPDADNGYLDAVEQRFSDQYKEVATEVGGSRDLKATLSEWRKEFGTN